MGSHWNLTICTSSGDATSNMPFKAPIGQKDPFQHLEPHILEASRTPANETQSTSKHCNLVTTAMLEIGLTPKHMSIVCWPRHQELGMSNLLNYFQIPPVSSNIATRNVLLRQVYPCSKLYASRSRCSFIRSQTTPSRRRYFGPSALAVCTENDL